MGKHKPKVKFRSIYTHKKVNKKWIITITIVTLIMAILLGYISDIFMDKVILWGAALIVFLIVLMGIFFDLLGIAVTAAEETPFHSMAASRVRGAKESILIIRNAGAVANFFNDVIGDIAGIISGVAGGAIVAMVVKYGLDKTVVTISLTGIIAAITVGGKAIGKEIALRHANLIVYRLGVIYSYMRKQNNK
ncbi:hypothetical protein HZI73_16535 [Vallitalea pronyensis]|uniref:CNNM transmembrane domain-containing protein n=1 Tax=Vallitalea pronyensis TaxID=1348613 RepID=A0A8J8SHF7_9FIRM|nr:Mg2+ and Co2+ transporter CorB [Vallitalea pronyensis]QUI23800.1 hypothetical protein HZI73_16535 [Vallitalea pronyensis]